MTATLDDIKAAIRQHLELPADEPIADHCDLADELNVDSLDIVEIAMHLEEKLGVTIRDAQIKLMTTPAAALEVVLSAQGGK